MVKALADVVEDKCLRSTRIKTSGVVVNSCGWIKDQGYECLLFACKAFKIDIVIVLDNELLFNLFKKDLPINVKIVHEPKSGGAEARNQQVRAMIRQNTIREYFYGIPPAVYTPFNFEISYASGELTIAKIGTEKLPESCLPVGMVVEDHRTKVC